MQVAFVVRAALVPWDDVIDLQSPLVGGHPTKLTAKPRSLEYPVLQCARDVATRLAPVAEDRLAALIDVLIKFLLAQGCKFIDLRLSQMLIADELIVLFLFPHELVVAKYPPDHVVDDGRVVLDLTSVVLEDGSGDLLLVAATVVVQ